MPTDTLSHAREVVAGADATAAGSMLGIIYRGERDTPPIAFSRDHPNFIAAQLADRCLRALADPATVEGVARALCGSFNATFNGGGWIEGPITWDDYDENGHERFRQAALATLTFILDQAGREATMYKGAKK